MMKRRSFLTAAGAAGLAASAAVIPSRKASAQTMKWRMANLYPRGISFGPAYQGFADNVKRMSGGRLDIQVVYDGEGVGATEVLGATKSGLVEMGSPYMALHAGELPAGVVELTLPGAPTQLDHLLALFYKAGWIEVLRKAYAEQGLYYLAPLFQPGVYLITKKPINSLDDLKGKVLRSPGAYGKFMRNLGVEPVVMAFSEMYPSMATGVIDGAASSNLIDYRDIKLVEIAKYMYPLAVTGAQCAGLIVNMDHWNKLPDDLKAIMDIAAVVHGIDHANHSTMWVREAVNEMEAKGLKWNPAPSDADRAKWKTAGENLAEEYAAADKWSAELIKVQRDFSKRMGI
jgi:TRAP-type mannitol/chloroaromatic compound transport system substrate-binding protein